MTRNISIIIITLIASAMVIGCSNSSTNPVNPASFNESDGISSDYSISESSTRELIGVWSIDFDIENLSANLEPSRNPSSHINVTPYLPMPVIQVISFNPIFRILDVDVTIDNKTMLDGYDVRLIIYTDDSGVMLRNADGWTDLWDITGGSIINPFKAYAKLEDRRKFEGQSEHTERLQLYMPLGIANVKFAIDASFPDNCSEPYAIKNFNHLQLKDIPGTKTKATVDIFNWNNEVTEVTLHCPAVTGEHKVFFNNVANNKWEVIIENKNGAPAGNYIGIIAATSDGSLYDWVQITITEQITAEWTIFYYAYEENLYRLRDNINEMEVIGSQEGILNMIVCWDETGTTDDHILHITKDPDGMNNRIISPKVEDYGEVIPPTGLDMPNPEQLTKFLRFAIREFPAKKYGFIMLSHGNYGIYYSVPGEKSFLDDMGAWEFRDAVKLALDDFPEIDRLDFVGLECCTMSFIELANCLRDCAKVSWSSQYVMYVYSARYDQVLSELLQNPTMDEYAFAELFVSNTLDTGGAFTYGAWDNDIAADVCIPALNVLSQQLMDHLDDYRSEITQCRALADDWGSYCGDHRISDLGLFCEHLIEYNPPLPESLTDAAAAMRDAIEQAFFYFRSKCSSPGCYCSGTGWQIVFTDQYNNPSYEYEFKIRDVVRDIGFADATLWDDFLMMYDINEY